MKQYKQQQFNEYEKYVQMGILSSATWHHDPKRLGFVLSRYKFVAKMLRGKNTVMEVGCGDAFVSKLVEEEVGKLICTDYDPNLINEAKEMRQAEMPNTYFVVHDMVNEKFHTRMDAIYCLDVFEHIEVKNEAKFIENITASLDENGVFIVGVPTLESQVYASEGSKQGHVNCKNGDELNNFVSKYFHNCFLFSMNDEVVHTGFVRMAHYVLVVCCGKKI